MKAQDVRQRLESFLKRTAREVVIPVSIFLSPALSGCIGSQGGTGGFVPIQGGQAGSATSSQGGTGGSATIGQGGTDGQIVACFPNCNPYDQQVTSGPGLDYSGDCPPERECYSLVNTCGSTLCVLPEGVHCSDLLSCDPGDTPTTLGNQDCGVRDFCYTNKLCAQSIRCRLSPYGGICSGTWSDAGILEPPDASADSSDAGRIPCCGDGIVDYHYGEMCDLGPLNGKCLDSQGNPTKGGCSIYCSQNCTMPI
jgi:hypothetical protein